MRPHDAATAGVVLSGTRKPRISPPGKELEWMLRYALPSAMAWNRSASAVAVDQPCAVM
jgi:hypothetical protein